MKDEDNHHQQTAEDDIDVETVVATFSFNSS